MKFKYQLKDNQLINFINRTWGLWLYILVGFINSLICFKTPVHDIFVPTTLNAEIIIMAFTFLTAIEVIVVGLLYGSTHWLWSEWRIAKHNKPSPEVDRTF